MATCGHIWLVICDVTTATLTLQPLPLHCFAFLTPERKKVTDGLTLLKTELFPFTAFWNDLDVFKPETVVATKVTCIPPGTQVQPTRKHLRSATFEHVLLQLGLAFMGREWSLFLPQLCGQQKQHGKYRLMSKSLAICMSPLLVSSHSSG